MHPTFYSIVDSQQKLTLINECSSLNNSFLPKKAHFLYKRHFLICVPFLTFFRSKFINFDHKLWSIHKKLYKPCPQDFDKINGCWRMKRTQADSWTGRVDGRTEPSSAHPKVSIPDSIPILNRTRSHGKIWAELIKLYLKNNHF